MSDQVNFQLNFQHNMGSVQNSVNALNAGIVQVHDSTINVDHAFMDTINNMNAGIQKIKFTSILEQIDRVSNALNSLSGPGMQFSTALADVSAITGVSGDALDDLSERARSSAIEFGGNASDSLNNYKTILSRLGPDIASVPAALESMEKQVQTLSKTMGGDAAGAVDALTTAVLQFGVDLSDPIAAAAEMDKMMNVMAAGAQQGAAEVPKIADALKVSGVAMKQMNVEFAEGNSALQALAKGGKEGAEAGTALRNVLGKMAGEDVIPKEAREKLRELGVNYDIVSDKTRPFTDRLRELKKAQGDATIMAQVFGVENAAAANILLDSIEAQEEMTRTISDTNTAYEMAAVVMESPAEKAAQLQARIDDLKLSIFSAAGGVMQYVGVVGEATRTITNILPLVNALRSAYTILTSREKLLAVWTGIKNGVLAAGAIVTGVITAATWAWNTATMALTASLLANPITWVIALVVALIALIAYLVINVEGWGESWSHVVNGTRATFEAFVNYVKLAWTTLVNGLMIGLNWIKKGWFEFKNAVGLGEESDNNKMIAQISSDTEKRKAEIVEAANNMKNSVLEAYSEFGQAGGSLSWKGQTLTQIVEEKQQQLGIKPAGGIPGADDKSEGAGKADSKESTRKLSKTNSSIATGGQRTVNNIFNIKTLAENHISGKTFKESVAKMEDEMTDALIRTLAMASATAG
jgi:TP901 family phage tail tape measure protein